MQVVLLLPENAFWLKAMCRSLSPDKVVATPSKHANHVLCENPQQLLLRPQLWPLPAALNQSGTARDMLSALMCSPSLLSQLDAESCFCTLQMIDGLSRS